MRRKTTLVIYFETRNELIEIIYFIRNSKNRIDSFGQEYSLANIFIHFNSE